MRSFSTIQNIINFSENFLNSKNDFIRINDEEYFSLLVSKIKNFNSNYKKIEINPKIIKQLILMTSINFCYWYGNSYHRINNSSSSKLGNIIYEAIENSNGLNHNGIIREIISKMVMERFPLLDERIRILKSISDWDINSIIRNVTSTKSLEEVFSIFLCTIPHFGNDFFLKKACLFFIELNRIFGLYEDEINMLIVPADYQVPKILHYFNCFQYSEYLRNKIDSDLLILPNSKEEISIRTATVFSCEQLKKLTNKSISDIDEFLWGNRDLCKNPFHLTITTDY